MLVLMSDEQGLHKSRGLRALIGDAWFADRLPVIATKDALIQLHGKVLIERPEVETLTDADKAFLSSSIDRFRAPYGRIAEDHPRTCSFAGTTNQPYFLDDPSGGRRYWPVEVTGGDRAWLRQPRPYLAAGLPR
jgi:predicted P-loop ATPase